MPGGRPWDLYNLDESYGVFRVEASRLRPVRDHLTGRLRKPGLDMLNKNNHACHGIPLWLPVPKELLQFLESSRLK